MLPLFVVICTPKPLIGKRNKPIFYFEKINNGVMNVTMNRSIAKTWMDIKKAEKFIEETLGPIVGDTHKLEIRQIFPKGGI